MMDRMSSDMLAIKAIIGATAAASAPAFALVATPFAPLAFKRQAWPKPLYNNGQLGELPLPCAP
jgi:hypothetical protein